MSALVQQREFCAWLLQGVPHSPVPGVDPARVQVHRNTFVGTLVEALAESFPVTRALAGVEFFDAMARERVLADPPRTPMLTEYAISFPGFLVGFEPAQGTPVLAAMAQLEALRLRAFHAADAEPIGLAAFHRLAGDSALLARTGARLHPAAQWLPARQPLLELWRRHDEAEDAAVVELGDIDADCAQDVLVHRPQFAVRMSLLPPGGIAFLDALAAGCSFATAFAEAAAASELSEPTALFSLLLQNGLVVQLIELTPESA